MMADGAAGATPIDATAAGTPARDGSARETGGREPAVGAPTTAAVGGSGVVIGGAPHGPFNFKAILQEMIRQNASDLHLKVGRPPTIRVQGQLAPLSHPAMRPEDLKSLAEQVMSPRQVKEFAENKEADFAIGVPGIGRFRVNVYQQRGTIAYALRAIPYQTSTIEELNLPAGREEIALSPRGLVLVTGITGSGKSTALAPMIQFINEKRRANIITIEDPIEFLHRDINCQHQSARSGHRHRGFAQALRRVLRQDPDVILIGEIRDLETMDTALKAADTGHLVLLDAPHHRRDADHQPRAVVLSAAPAGRSAHSRSSSALAAVISLRLVPRADSDGARPGVRGADQHGRRARQYPRHARGRSNIPDLIAEGTRPIRHADVRPVADELVQRGRHHVRERGLLRDQPERVRAPRAGRRGVERHELGRFQTRTFSEVTVRDARHDRPPDVHEGADCQPRRDRAAGHPRLPRTRRPDRWRCTPRRIANRCTSASPTTTSASGPPPARDSLPATFRASSPPPRSPAPTRSIRATASSPRTPNSPRLRGVATSTFIGPTAEQIRAMGDKAARAGAPMARRRARSCPAPPAPWRTPKRRSAFARESASP